MKKKHWLPEWLYFLSKKWDPWWDSQSARGQAVLSVLLSLKRMGSGRPVNVIGGGCQSKQNTAGSGVFLMPSESTTVDGAGEVPEPWFKSRPVLALQINLQIISRPQKPFLKLTSKTIPTVGRGITGPSFFQELICSQCSAWCWGKQAL